MTDTSWQLLARDCFHDALRTYPEFEREYFVNAELHANVEHVNEVLTAVIACMEGEGIDAPAVERIIRSTWQVMIGSTLRAVAQLKAAHDVR